MKRLPAAFSFAVALATSAGVGMAQEPASFGGVWSLNRALSVIPREIGFNVDWMPPPEGRRDAGSTGGRGRRSSGGGRGGDAPFPVSRESSEDYRRVQLVTTQARNPPARMTIVDTLAAITITNELGQSRVLHPNGIDEWIQIEGVSIRVTARRDGERLTLVYHVEADRDVRYTFVQSQSAGSVGSQLSVDVEFLERGAVADKANLVYQPGLAAETTAAAATPPSTGVPAAPGANQQPEKFDARPGAELRGLKTLGILVEDLGNQAIACGLNRDAIEAALTARLTSGGFVVRKNSDDDTYVYVNVMTTNLNGTCVSRYDTFLYTHATANLSYRDQPVLVQVSLMHRGGIATTAPVNHAPTVTRGLENYVDLFMTQIREANK